jgi:hypothetical protein
MSGSARSPRRPDSKPRCSRALGVDHTNHTVLGARIADKFIDRDRGYGRGPVSHVLAGGNAGRIRRCTRLPGRAR